MSKISEVMMEIFNKGYELSESGEITKPNGNKANLFERERGYKYFSAYSNVYKRNFRIKASRFAAYCLYGREVFGRGNAVHLTSDDDGVYTKDTVMVVDSYTDRCLRDGDMEMIGNYILDESLQYKAIKIIQSNTSDYNKTVARAYLKGYRVLEDGRFVNPVGFILPIKNYKHPKRYTYPTSSFRYEGKYKAFKIHRLAAFCFFGEEILNTELEVRHINGDVCDVSYKNIKLGNHRENIMDIPENHRKNHMDKIRKQSLKIIRHLSKDQVIEIDNMLKNTRFTQREISEKTGVPEYTVRRINKRKIYKEYLGVKLNG